MIPNLIRHMGNCGSFKKLERIVTALKIAKSSEAQVLIVLDELVYGQNVTRIEAVKDFDYNKSEIIINEHKFPWWDITKVNLVF